MRHRLGNGPICLCVKAWVARLPAISWPTGGFLLEQFRFHDVWCDFLRRDGVERVWHAASAKGSLAAKADGEACSADTD
jgi:hypothetical protein